MRLNLKKSVRNESRVRNSQTSGPTPRSATMEPVMGCSLSLRAAVGCGVKRCGETERVTPEECYVEVGTLAREQNRERGLIGGIRDGIAGEL
jgi:hypothetical protein